MTGVIFDIKEFAVHDGPGPRTTVFFKGCPLRCQWCHNPEGLSREPQLMWRQEKCTGCGLCCQGADHDPCAALGRCWHHCSTGALTLSGQTWEVEALAERLLRDAPLLSSMGGGITVSGGEPLYQPAFLMALLQALSGVHLAMETSGYAAPKVFEAAVERLDYVIMDIKLADGALHRQYTGVDNGPILENFAHLRRSGKPHTVRVPLIPGITDGRENLEAIARIVQDSPVQLLQYNPLAPAKYGLLGQDYPLKELPQPQPVDLSVFHNAALLKL